MKKKRLQTFAGTLLGFALLWGSTACTAPTPAAPLPAATPRPSLSPPPAAAPSSVARPTLAVKSPPPPTPLPGPSICSPLEDVTFAQLKDILSNPFVLNRPGLDDGHQGADFAYYRFGSHVGMAGLPIHAVLPGRVAAAISARPPYGNAIIIETPFELLSETWLSDLPEPGPFVEPQPAMNCPAFSIEAYNLKGKKSLYLLYAHMQSPSPVAAGAQVSCGQQIGQVGTTGESVNEHLHLETRVGPSGVNFSSMAYYDTSRTEEEAVNYCIWRTSNIFHLFDPMDLLSHGQTSPAENS